MEFWGTRGSIPSPGPDTARFGGNTSCVEVRVGGQHIIFDAGTGIRPLGTSLLLRGVRDLHLLMSHYHWDHIMGLPFFPCLFDSDVSLALYGEPRGEESVEQVLAGQMVPPYFPVPWDVVQASVSSHNVRPGMTFTIGEVVVHTCRLNHPQEALSYRVEYDGRSVVYATDLEHGTELDEAFRDFIRGADMLIMDCSFQDSEYPKHIGWGHSTWETGVRFADAAGVGQLVIFHHLPQRTDAEVEIIEAAAARLRPGTVAAAEGLVLPVRGGARQRKTGT
ncbi:MAG: MBL fold metallo-hydrolase [Deltaproteobacteria bacterium]|nr:MBL fold metallo-hydrolase [Deltaproteobacteria bacterium]